MSHATREEEGPSLLIVFRNELLADSSRWFHTVFKFISKHLIINWFSTRNHPDSWLPWINPTRTTDRADLQKSSSKRGG